MGWRGVAIEPQTVFNEKWQQHRSEDMLVNAALAASTGEATLYKPLAYGQAATIHPGFAAGFVQRGLETESRTVKTHTLTEVLAQARPQGDIHLLSIDVEGAEHEVLLGLDLARFRPWLMVLESVLPGLPIPHYAEWEPLLLAQGYEFVYFDAVNRFYVATEHAELKVHFDHPPCVWDDFVSHELQHLRAQNEKLTTAAQWMLASANRFRDMGDHTAYESLLWHIFELLPTFEDVYWPLGTYLVGHGRRTEALAFYQQAAMHSPHHLYCYQNIGLLHRWAKRFDESEAAFKRMMEVNPSFHDGRLSYGMLLLGMGRYKEGWELFESRHQAPEGEVPRMSHNAPYPMWTGQPLEGKAILILREQGYGDEIMFVRFAKDLKARGALRVVLVCQAPIKTLLQTVPGIDETCSVEDLNNVWPAADFWCYEQSLPHALGVTLDTLPAAIPYISAQPITRMAWRTRLQNELPAGTLKVGVAWRGSPAHGNDHNRSLASLAVLRPLWDAPGVSFVSLQTVDAVAEARNPPIDQPLLELGSHLTDFADGAALVAELDLVISVDTAIVHIAGALGVPCWVMVPYIDTDWRWLNDRDDSPWYPVGMRIFRQTSEGAWDGVIEGLKTALQALSSKALS
jgi:FkbM family methyltransferase